ncbi:MAG: DNA mismatch repair endonuclease MutL [Puniceicoccaceae bacterium]
MSRIHVLPDHVANQIAAGEVVERPVAVVKELIENSLDAGATRIQIEARRGGKSLIRVSDNGRGMTAAEAVLCLRRHATSKIETAEDLLRIASFGFRGEALPSIASVSDFTLRTRTAGSPAGVRIRVTGGELSEPVEEAHPPGTSVEVARLFNTVPARRKFLKTDQTEAAHIVQIARLFALAHPAVGFTLRLDGKDHLSSPPCAGLPERISEIWGKKMLTDTLPFERRSGPLFLYGRLGRPPLSRATRQDLVCVVNGRPVDSRTIQYGILEACTGFLPKGRYPVAFFFLEINPEAIDVNVHPTKREIRFRDEPQVRRVVVETVLDLLLDQASSAAGSPAPDLPLPPNFEPVAPAAPPPGSPPGGNPAAGRPPPVGSGNPVRLPEPAPTPAAARPDFPPDPPAPADPVRWRWIGPLGPSTLLFRSPRGLVVFHPRAASERILYEQFLAETERGGIPTQTLLIPQTFEWDPVPAQCLEENREIFADHGFEVESFGKNFFRVSGVPAWFEPGQAETFLRDAVSLIREGVLRPRNAGPFRERMAALAARTAHRRDRRLSEDEALRLVRRLLRTSVPHSCPAGKPTFLEFEDGDLEKRFGRSL